MKRIANRERSQVIVSLGEGERGITHLNTLKAQADRAGLSLSTWCRRTLFAVCDIESDEFVRREEVVALERCVAALERQLSLEGAFR